MIEQIDSGSSRPTDVMARMAAATRIDEPAPDADETDMLLFAVERSRAQFAWKAGGLDAAGLHRRHPPSTMTMAGLIDHLAQVEDSYVTERLLRRPATPPWDGQDREVVWRRTWNAAAQQEPEQLYGRWLDTVARARAGWQELLAERGPSGASATEVAGVPVNLRRFLVDLHDEYARHVGHADLLREAIDGVVGEDPPQP